MVGALVFLFDGDSYSFPRQAEREEFRANLPHAIWLSRCVLDINLEYTKFTKVGRDIAMCVTTCTKSQSTTCDVYIYTLQYRYLMYHPFPLGKGRVFCCLSKNYQGFGVQCSGLLPKCAQRGCLSAGPFPWWRSTLECRRRTVFVLEQFERLGRCHSFAPPNWRPYKFIEEAIFCVGSCDHGMLFRCDAPGAKYNWGEREGYDVKKQLALGTQHWFSLMEPSSGYLEFSCDLFWDVMGFFRQVISYQQKSTRLFCVFYWPQNEGVRNIPHLPTVRTRTTKFQGFLLSSGNCLRSREATKWVLLPTIWVTSCCANCCWRREGKHEKWCMVFWGIPKRSIKTGGTNIILPN